MSKQLQESLVDRLGREALAAKEVVREMHQAIKDAKQVLRELREAQEELEGMLISIVDNGIQKAVDMRMAEFHQQVDEVKMAIERKLWIRFDKLMNTMLYGNEKGEGESVIDLARKRGLLP